MTPQHRSILALIGACTIWGLSSMFYKLLAHVPPGEVLAWRTVSSVVFFAAILGPQNRLHELRAAFSSRQMAALVLLAALMIAANWFFFIFSIQAGRAVESALGYYVFPLVAVAMGRVVFGEKLHPLQWLAVGIAALAVSVLTWGLGAAPWISMILAVTFATYGALKKRLPLGPVISVMAEVLWLLPVALVWLALRGHIWDLPTYALLLAAGPMTGVPLILFSRAARGVRMSTVGLVQYMNPTLQFFVAVLVFAEPFTRWHAIAFPMIWGALALYSLVAMRQDRAARKAAQAASASGTAVK